MIMFLQEYLAMQHIREIILESFELMFFPVLFNILEYILRYIDVVDSQCGIERNSQWS